MRLIPASEADICPGRIRPVSVTRLQRVRGGRDLTMRRKHRRRADVRGLLVWSLTGVHRGCRESSSSLSFAGECYCMPTANHAAVPDITCCVGNRRALILPSPVPVPFRTETYRAVPTHARHPTSAPSSKQHPDTLVSRCNSLCLPRDPGPRV